MMSEESLIAESYSNLKSAILLGRTDIVRGILSTAAESRFENGFFEDEVEDDGAGEDFRIRKWDEDYEDNPYDILRVMLNYVDDDAGTALHLATKLSNADITRALLSAGADPTRLNKEGASPFEYCSDEKILRIYNEQLLEAAAHNQITKLERLLFAGVSSNANDGTESNNRAIHWAATFGGYDAVKLLCQHNADVNAVNSEGSTALFDAVKRRDKDIVELLLSYGAKSDICILHGSNKGKTPVDFAPEDSELKQLLLNPPESINDTNEKKENAVTNGLLNASDDSIVSSTNGVPEGKSDIRIEETDNSHEIDLSLLWPYPQKLTLIKGSRFHPEAYLSVRILTERGEDPHIIHDMWRAVDEIFQRLGVSVRTLCVADNAYTELVPGCITCSISPLLFMKPESYSINISSHKINLCGSDHAGLWYSINTLLQLFRMFKGVGIPRMQVYDWPDLKYRAYLVDCSHGRALTLESLFFLVDILANMKYNQIMLCVEHDLHLKGKSGVKYNFPYSQGELFQLERYCRKRYLELVPCTDLHLCEEKNIGLKKFNSFISSSFPQSRFVHIGFGEVNDAVINDKDADHNSLMNHVQEIYDHYTKQRKVCLMWSNSFHEYIKNGNILPYGVIAMEYGGNSSHDFGVFSKLCSDSGIPYYICPGTMSWASLVGADSFDLIDDAVQTAVNYNALGVLVTDWSGYGHVTPFEVSFPALATGGTLTWNSKMKQESVTSSISKVLDLHVFQDDAGVMGDILKSLCQVHQLLEPSSLKTHSENHIPPRHKAEDASQLLKLFLFPNNVDISMIDIDRLQTVTRCLRKSQASLSLAQMKSPRSSTITKVLNLNLDMAIYACRMGRALMVAKSDNTSLSGFTVISRLPSINRTDLANRLLGIIENHRRVWSLSNKPVGLDESNRILENVFKEIVPSSTLTV